MKLIEGGFARHAARRAHDGLLSAAEPWLRPTNVDQQVLLSGTGRGGTTVFMRSLALGTRGASIYEPFRPGFGRAPDGLLPDHGYLRLTRGQDAPSMHSHVERVLSGGGLTRWSTSQERLRSLRVARTLIVKDVRVSRALGWFRENFPSVLVRVIVRHPVSVIESMLSAPLGWSEMSYTDIVVPAAITLDVHPGELAAESDSRAVWLAALWIADTWAMVHELDQKSLTSGVHYEDLVLSPHATMERTSTGISDFDVERATQALRTPSATASPGLVSGQLPALADVISSRDLRRIFALIEMFGLAEMYESTSLVPGRRVHDGAWSDR